MTTLAAGKQTAIAAVARMPRLHLPGVNALRVIGVLAVIYSHISFYFRDDRNQDWWLLDFGDLVFTRGAGLNNHLSFVGVSIFLVLTGMLVTASAVNQTRLKYLVLRIGRLLPMFWVATAGAIVLVYFGVTATFGARQPLTASYALMSFGFGGFFAKPEVVVLGVVWTLFVQIVFYIICAAARPLLAENPALLPTGAAVIQLGVVALVSELPVGSVPEIVQKTAIALSALFLGQVVYLVWSRVIGWPAALCAAGAQSLVLLVAGRISNLWGIERYLWTVLVSVALVVLVARLDNRLTSSAVVRWIGTRSFAIYLVHTLVLYKVYNLTVDVLGVDLALLLFVGVTAVVAEVLYRFIEIPAANGLADWVRHGGLDRATAPVRSTVKMCRGWWISSREQARS